MKGIDAMDDPSQKPYGEHETVWEGLGILDYVIVPHFRSDHPESATARRAVARLEEQRIPFRTLQDGEVIIVEETACG